MTWVKLDDQFYDNPKVLAAGIVGRDLYLQALAYTNRQLTDGFIPAVQVRRFDTPKPEQVARQLVTVGLWEPVEGGYCIHDFHEYNASAAKIKAEREEDRRRKAAARAEKSGQSPPYVPTESDRTNNGHRPESGQSPNGIRALDVDPYVDPISERPGSDPTNRPKKQEKSASGGTNGELGRRPAANHSGARSEVRAAIGVDAWAKYDTPQPAGRTLSDVLGPGLGKPG